MRTTYSDRLRLERRLLTALYLWPSECSLTPEHFISPAHSALYEVIQGIKRAPVADDVLAVTYDDTALAHAALRLLDCDLDGLFANEGGFWSYALKLQQSGDTRAEIPSLIEQVRECPRCGR